MILNTQQFYRTLREPIIVQWPVGDNINIMKTTFELNFDFYQAFKQHDTQKYGNKQKLSI